MAGAVILPVALASFLAQCSAGGSATKTPHWELLAAPLLNSILGVVFPALGGSQAA
ncbi:hypothetical protein [Amycolatopsis sp. NPDC050768]|uniref:hypothetical protein n=1 Tax=Amycolatopsis sp. NPDC050768 TaxID=3154839 RepID=UPI0033FE0D6C